MAKLFAMAVPILPGQTERSRNFIADLNGKKAKEFKENRARLGVRERTFLQSTPQGDFVVVTLEGNDPESAFKNFGKGTDEFTKWFTTEVKAIHGIDLAQPPQGKTPELVIDSQESIRATA